MKNTTRSIAVLTTGVLTLVAGWGIPLYLQSSGADRSRGVLLEIAEVATTTTTVATSMSQPSTTVGVVVAVEPVPPKVATFGDSSMMFMNAEIAKISGISWIPVPSSLAVWTSGTGGFDRNGCGVMKDAPFALYKGGEVGYPAGNHGPKPELTCDWEKWVEQASDLAKPEVAIISYGPTSMWGHVLEGGDPLTILDANVYASVLDAHEKFRETLSKVGVRKFVWVAYPHVATEMLPKSTFQSQYWNNPMVANRYYELLVETGDTVIDLRDMNNPENFVDGTHFTKEAAKVAASRIQAALVA